MWGGAKREWIHVSFGAGAELDQYHRGYAYTRDLLELESRRAVCSLADIPAELQWIRTPLQVHEWERSLRVHPDREFCQFLLRGMTEGFRIGFR